MYCWASYGSLWICSVQGAAGHTTVYGRWVWKRTVEFRRKWHLLRVASSVCQHPFCSALQIPCLTCAILPVLMCWDYLLLGAKRERLLLYFWCFGSVSGSKDFCHLWEATFKDMHSFLFFTILILVLSYPSLGLIICFTSWSKYFLLLYDVGFF